MRTLTRALVPFLVIAFPAVARAEDRDFCANRPGLGTPPCTMAPGEVMVEVGGAAWDHSSDPASVEDDVTLGDALVRVGIADSAEVQVGLTGFGSQRTRDRASGEVKKDTGVGDALVAVRRGLAGANGPVAIEAYVTLPVGREPIGAGRVEGGVLLPAQLDLPAGFQLALTPEVDLVANTDRGGHHVAWGSVVGLSHALTKALGLAAEVQAFRDDDPSGHSTDARVAGSLAWQVGERFQLDLEVDAGLSHGAPDRTIAVGFARRFR